MDATAAFAAERPRLVTLAARVLRDPTEAEDVAQQAWLRLNGTSESIANVPAWLTTVTVRLCLDRLKSRTPVPVHDDLLHDRLGGETDQGRSADPAAHSVLDAIPSRFLRERTAVVTGVHHLGMLSNSGVQDHLHRFLSPTAQPALTRAGRTGTN